LLRQANQLAAVNCPDGLLSCIGQMPSMTSTCFDP
jgi:hypothetical protein